MFEKLKNSRETRLAATISVGVFGGLLAYRLFIWTHEWWIDDLNSNDQQRILLFALIAAIAVSTLYVIRKLVRHRRLKRFMEAVIPDAPIHLYKGVRGWLLFFCVVLTVLTPAANLSQAGALATYGNLPMAYRLFVLAISAFSAYAGIGLWRVSPGAVKRAQAFLWTLLICVPAISIGMALAGKIPAQNAITDSVRSAVFFAVWSWYLNQSKRVKATYGLH